MRLAESKLSSMDQKDLPPIRTGPRVRVPSSAAVSEWTTRSVVQLLESIGSATVVAEIPAGARVDGVTGESGFEPQPYGRPQDNGLLKAGDVILLSRLSGRRPREITGTTEPQSRIGTP